MHAVIGLTVILLFTACKPRESTDLSSVYSVEDMAWQDGNSLWVCGSKGIAQLDIVDDTITIFDFSCEDILVARDGTVWASDFGGIRSFDGQSWQSHTLPNSLAEFVNGGLLLETSDGTIWLGTLGLGQYDSETGSWRVMLPPLPDTPSHETGLPREGRPGSIYALVETTDGAVWIASNVGVVRLDSTSQQTWTVSNGLACNSVRSLLETRDGAVLAGTDCGISRWDGNTWQTLPAAISTDTDGNTIIELLLEASDGTVWAATWAGVVHWDGSVWQTWPIAQGLSHHRGVRVLLETRDGTIWAGTWGSGVARWNGNEWRMYSTADGLADDRVQILLDDSSGALLAGTFGGGVSFYDSEADQWLPFFELADR